MPKKTAKNKKVWVVLYGHKHGTDFWCNSTEKKAWKSIAGVILDNIDEVDDETGESVKIRIAEGKIGDAAQLWFNATEEWFEVDFRVIDA